MNEPSYRQHIVVDPEILSGKPAIKGTRIPVTLILNLLANGYTFERIVQAYPVLTVEDVRAAAADGGSQRQRHVS
ncbi:MAG TPA: DUF433 domain-containing protein [Thermomicrobiales bacterium]|jgi:uncharacterized protein (DUF433 family)